MKYVDVLTLSTKMLISEGITFENRDKNYKPSINYLSDIITIESNKTWFRKNYKKLFEDYKTPLIENFKGVIIDDKITNKQIFCEKLYDQTNIKDKYIVSFHFSDEKRMFYCDKLNMPFNLKAIQTNSIIIENFEDGMYIRNYVIYDANKLMLKINVASLLQQLQNTELYYINR